MSLKLCEVLSPAGNKEMLIAAIRSGADAVYLGAKDFSARRNAENFSIQELRETVAYCHIRGVKVYLTLNILIKDNELESAFLLAKSAYNFGIDGIIIQDLGLARILHKKIPELKLHASTQMSVHSPSALGVLKKLGFCRVVAAREMSKKQLTALCEQAKQLDMEVEVFVHGALCMSVSGQCLLSAFLGSRSGNRGLCAGPCRLPFKVEGGTGHDLSLKDLSLTEYIRELSEMGVASFKIEGRMKRPEYVAAATAACRQAYDIGRVEPLLAQTLKNVFSRSGFTDGYYTDCIGKEMFGVRTKDDVISANKAFPYLHEIYRLERKNVPIKLKAEILRDKPMCILFSDHKNEAEVLSGMPTEAEKRAITKEDIQKNLSKLGDTPYYIEKAEISVDEGLFVSASELNAIRRKACEILSLKRANVNNITDSEYIYQAKENKIKERPNIYIRVETVEQIPKEINGISGIIFPIEKQPDFFFERELLFIVDIPSGICDENAIKERLKIFKEKGFKIAMCGNLAAVEIAQSLGFSIMAGTGLNITNSEAIKTAELLGMESVIISPEEQIAKSNRMYSPISKGAIVYGNIPLMLLKNCPLKNGASCKECNGNGKITDRMGVQFPVRCRMGFSELLNSRPIWMADKKEDLTSFDFWVIYFTGESGKRAREIINAYLRGEGPDIEYTRGLYYRGTI